MNLRRSALQTAFGLFLVVLSVSGCSRSVNMKATVTKNTSVETPRIACITKMQTGEHWGAIKSGARSAATELGASMEFFAPINESNHVQQAEYIGEAIDRGVDAILLAASHQSVPAAQVASARSKGIPVITIDSGIVGTDVEGHIGSDNRELGALAARTATDLLEDHIPRVYVIGSLADSMNMAQRIMGIETEINLSGGDILGIDYSGAEENTAKILTGDMLEKHPEISVIIALEENSAHGAADIIQEKGLKDSIILIGFGSSRQEISLLENDVIDALVVENPFTMGYLGVSAAVDLARGKKSVTSVTTNHAVITKDTLRTPGNQRLAFPVY